MKKLNIKTIPVFMAFLCMGFGDVVGPLTSQLQNTYELSNFMAGLVTFMGFIMFGLLSIPMGLYQDRKGKKHVLVLGLFLALLGLVLPIIGQYSSFGLLLGALLLLGAGATTLQVAGNPIMRDVSAPGNYSRNLSFGQFIKAIGSLSGALIPLVAVNYWGKDWRIVFPIYAVVILVTILIIMGMNVKEKEEKSEPATFRSCFSLLKNRYITLMVVGIFVYVGAEVTMSARLPSYLEHQFNFDIEKLGLYGTLFFFLTLMIGRFLGGVILNWLAPKKFLIITSLISVIGVIMLYFSPSSVMGFVTIALIGLGFANIFPLIFSITIDAYPDRGNEISGLMVTAIIGGAIMPVLFGAVADIFNLMAGFIVPGISMLYIILIAITLKNK
jgi:fucose permease